MVLVGNDLYIADTDAIRHFPYQTGQTRITVPDVVLTPLPGGPIDHHWTRSLTASPGGSKLYACSGQNPIYPAGNLGSTCQERRAAGFAKGPATLAAPTAWPRMSP